MPEPSVEEFLSAYTPAVRDLVLKARQLVLDVLPEAVELVDPPSRLIAYGFGERYADLVCAIAPYQSYANLIFSKGAHLPDPAGLLTGTGKHARHVKIRSTDDLEHPAVRELIQAAIVITKGVE